MAVSHARVVDPRSIAGVVQLDIDPARFHPDQSATQLGLFALFSAEQDHETGFKDNVAVVLTRFVVDSTVDVNDLFDHAFIEARSLSGWIEHRADRYPITSRTQGASIQAGNYQDPAGRWLYSINKYEVHQRANVGYLLQCTGTTISQQRSAWSELIDSVSSARFDD
ncbi:LpqN/LpqT family lipoprotein [Gordonia rubripertincta]|uniref:LpqN/LpqT family lipoprotein n=1 Tax=Gordonia rubripertincta TaxID=36822 RepID=A0AAW4GB08_GORRU|nr:LpqN/LpqT family lipoprotein [Gordonia rubripertincta]MBM7280151.1 LpqN/LpqT family lipoprotein [Gordonia rubripertincta]QMU22124.1 LpqN/LpqT family lipoprotein [Gordonia rubripertincta]